MSRARHLLGAWPALRRSLRQPRVLLLDFDGTLAPIRRDPQAPRLSPALRRRLQRLARRDVLGIITGRTLRDIRRRAGISGIWYAGSHGYEIQAPRGKRRLRLTLPERRLVARIARSVLRQLAGLPGLFIEPKPGMVAVHYRRASAATQARALRVLQGIAAQHPQAAWMYGKKVWDLAPQRPERISGKWAAVDYILRRVGARRSAVVYVGDDVTDEQVFRHLRGVTVVVGRRKKTAARYFLKSPAEVAQFLQKWEEEL